MFNFVKTKYFYISIFSILFLLVLSFATFVLVKPTKNDTLIPSTKKVEVAKNEPEFSWYTKTISAKFVGVESGKIILWDEEDDIKFSYGSQDIPILQYKNLQNNYQKGDKVQIEVQSLVNTSSGEVVKRESSKIFL